MQSQRRFRLLIQAMLVIGLASGCQTIEPFEERAELPRLDQEALLETGNFPRYALQPGDLLELIFNLEYAVSGDDYRLDVLDQIEIRELDHPELDGTYLVRTDGKISLPYKGSVRVAGLTVDELTERLVELYADLFVDSRIFVKLVEFGARIEELKRVVSSDRRGQIFEARVRPDGFVTLPVVGELLVAGFLPEEINEKIEEQYAKYYSGIQVSSIVRETPGNVFFVLGEVDGPGAIPAAASDDGDAGAGARRRRPGHGGTRDRHRGQHLGEEAARPCAGHSFDLLRRWCG